MREVVGRDEKWITADREKELQERYRELENKYEALVGHLANVMGPEIPAETVFEEVLNEPTESELVTISLLMRLYDLNLALLSHFDEARANEVYEAHTKGEHFNPPIFVPKMLPGESS